MQKRPTAYRDTLTGRVLCVNCTEERAYFFPDNGFEIGCKEPLYEDNSAFEVILRRIADGVEVTGSVGTSYPEDYADAIVNARAFFVALFRPRDSACSNCQGSLRTPRRRERSPR
jgi:hypothetical protein